MFGILSAIPIIGQLFSTVDNITNAIKDERIVKVRAKTEEERIATEERINTLQLRRDVLINRSGRPWDQLITTLFAIPVLLIDVKLIVVDKIIGSFYGCTIQGLTKAQLDSCSIFRTDTLSTEMLAYIGAVHAFYFLYIATRK